MPSSQADGGPSAAAGVDRLWIVLPVHNEAASIERVVREWVPHLSAADPEFVLLIVDDGSTDETPAILERLSRADPRLRVVRQANRGHGSACRHGYEMATSEGSDAAFVLQIDSDGQCDPAHFIAFWSARHAHPQQLGRRRRRGDGWLRTATSRTFAWLVSLFAGRRIHDPNVPYRMLHRDALATAVGRLRSSDDVELANSALSVVCAEAGPVRWVDIGFRQRHAGQSKYSATRMARLAAGLLWWLVRDRSAWGNERRRALTVRAAALVAWCVLAFALSAYAARNLGSEALWYDEVMQIHTSLGVDPMGRPFLPEGSLRDVIVRNGIDQLDPGGFGVLLHFWMQAFGTDAEVLRTLSGLLALVGLVALAALARRWIPHPMAAPAAVGLALLDPLVREHALEVRPYALELAGVWVSFWVADRLLASPRKGRGVALGLGLVALLGSRYSAFLTGAALTGAALLHFWPLLGRNGDKRHRAAVLGILVPPLLALAVMARASVPGLVRRASWNGGALVDYLAPYTSASLTLLESLAAALRHLSHPSVLGLTIAAAFALWVETRNDDREPAPAAFFVQRAALLLLALTMLLWHWHPWDPATKWSLYLRLVSTVCVLRLAADLAARLAGYAIARRAMTVAAVCLIALGAWLVATHQRGRWDVAFPALVRTGNGLVGERVGAVAVDPHPMPAVRYHYEFGALRGRPEYPRAFLLPVGGAELSPEAMCGAAWLLSFAPIDTIRTRYPALRFERDPVADQLLRVAPADPSTGSPCSGRTSGSPIERASSGAAR